MIGAAGNPAASADKGVIKDNINRTVANMKVSVTCFCIVFFRLDQRSLNFILCTDEMRGI